MMMIPTSFGQKIETGRYTYLRQQVPSQYNSVRTDVLGSTIWAHFFFGEYSNLLVKYRFLKSIVSVLISLIELLIRRKQNRKWKNQIIKIIENVHQKSSVQFLSLSWLDIFVGSDLALFNPWSRLFSIFFVRISCAFFGGSYFSQESKWQS